MKLFYSILVLLFASSDCISQPKYKSPQDNMDWFIRETTKIMKELKIGIRSNLSLDTPITYQPDRHFDNLNAYFNPGIIQLDPPYLDTSARYYLRPIIYTSFIGDSIITGKVDTNKLTFLKAYSAVIHEVSHYLQATDQEDIAKYFPVNMKDEVRYIKQPLEFEAYAVGAYFFIKYYNKKEVKKIMRIADPINIQRKLISLFRKVVYPWRENGFD